MTPDQYAGIIEALTAIAGSVAWLTVPVWALVFVGLTSR